MGNLPLESQERMLITVPQKTWSAPWQSLRRKTCKQQPLENLSLRDVYGSATKSEIVADIDMEFMFNPCESMKVATIETLTLSEPEFEDIRPDCSSWSCGAQILPVKKASYTYDHEVKGNTALKPLHGDYAGPNDAAVNKPVDTSTKGLAISSGMNPSYGKIDPYWMAASAIDEAVRNNIAVGGKRIAILDNFTWGNPEKPERLGSLVRACQACYDVSVAFRTPFISGKDSLYNESPLGPVTPTLLITAIGIVPDIGKTVSVDLKTAGNLLYVIGDTYLNWAGQNTISSKASRQSVPKLHATKARKMYYNLSKAMGKGIKVLP